jgi:hypothetical protein
MDCHAVTVYPGMQDIDIYDYFHVAFKKSVMEDPDFPNCRERLGDEEWRQIKAHCLTTDEEMAELGPSSTYQEAAKYTREVS